MHSSQLECIDEKSMFKRTLLLHLSCSHYSTVKSMFIRLLQFYVLRCNHKDPRKRLASSICGHSLLLCSQSSHGSSPTKQIPSALQIGEFLVLCQMSSFTSSGEKHNDISVFCSLSSCAVYRH